MEHIFPVQTHIRETHCCSWLVISFPISGRLSVQPQLDHQQIPISQTYLKTYSTFILNFIDIFIRNYECSLQKNSANIKPNLQLPPTFSNFIVIFFSGIFPQWCLNICISNQLCTHNVKSSKWCRIIYSSWNDLEMSPFCT